MPGHDKQRCVICLLHALQLYNTAVTEIDKDAKRVTLSNGDTICYEALITTIPLDTTLAWLGKQKWAQQLQHSSTHIIGVGIRGNW